ncbi:CubicO group peptidase, beta-lactamase class C family [Butyrivibrio sp. Su6]|uniref:serine hydrolase domain-containing protein n=1 Tax=Butyrivibrio sp. Su6 TaxID=1520810 RepID=UPI00089E7B67|nr:serine hydrolase domain-containing protein [Butyrivibrio sp. Su6]SEG12120.1 CubicO group peptidase, beta-lactamase class C family [Butyrivibrio sp. Su6]
MFSFNRAYPEDVSISSSSIKDLLEFLDGKEIPMHSLLIMRNNKLIFEKYYAPYKAATLHRMFSISKSITALAVFLLIDKGLVGIGNSITDYFPEYVNDSIHQWVKDTTIRNMLEMRTCHASTTYKVDMKSDWVESFFTVEPTHKPGTVFHYDTSAAHVLSALVEKMTQMPMLDYLKENVFNYMDFSKDSYMVKDPFGVSMGGSGLVATPMDFMKILYLIDKKGTIECNDGVTRNLLPSNLIELATSNISDTVMTAPIPGESQGYGMQIWQNEKGGYVLYGMGGQLGISIPDKNLLVITTADTQGIQGGNQVIYDGIYQFLLPGIDEKEPVVCLKAPSEDYEDLVSYADTLSIAPPKLAINHSYTKYNTKKLTSDLHQTYELLPNKQGFSKVQLDICPGNAQSTITFFTDDPAIKSGAFKLSFGLEHMEEGIFPKYDNPYTAGAVFLRENVLYIRFHLIGESVGSIRMELYFGDNDITIFMRKIEETYFKEFDGHLYGTLEN